MYAQLRPAGQGQWPKLSVGAVGAGALFFVCALMVLGVLVVVGGWYQRQASSAGYGCDAELAPMGADSRQAASRTCWPHRGDLNSAIAPLESNQARFLVVGDWGRDGYCCQMDVAREMDRIANASFVVGTGDSFYATGLRTSGDAQVNTSWANIYLRRRPLPWLSVLGNRDYRGNISALTGISHPLWSLPARHWDRLIKIGPVKLHLYFIDTTPMVAAYRAESSPENTNVASQWTEVDAQLSWLTAALKASAPHHINVVVGHHPVYDSGWDQGEDDNFLRSHLAPILNTSKVTAYFAGHEHNLQIHRPRNEHTRYFISGAGSKIDGYFSSADLGLEFYWDETPGFLVVTASAGLGLQVDFIEAKRGNLVHSTYVPK